MKKLIATLAIALSGGFLVTPAHAATTPVKPSMTLHYVYNCTNPTVEADFSKVGGIKDVYAHTDQGNWLIAEDFNFDATKVYDGYYSLPGVYQVDLFVTNANAGPYGSRVVGKSTAATAQCPTYSPVYDAHWVEPTPPAGSLPIEFSNIEWFRNRD